MLRVQNDALALRSDEFRRVSSEKRELSGAWKVRGRSSTLPRPVKEMAEASIGSRGSGAVLDEIWTSGLGEILQELADIGSFSSPASGGEKSRRAALCRQAIFDGFGSRKLFVVLLLLCSLPLRSGSTPTHGKAGVGSASQCEKTFQSGAGVRERQRQSVA